MNVTGRNFPATSWTVAADETAAPAPRCDALLMQADESTSSGYGLIATCCRTEHRDDIHIDGRTFPVIPWRRTR
jgi:hypothetical protein